MTITRNWSIWVCTMSSKVELWLISAAFKLQRRSPAFSFCFLPPNFSNFLPHIWLFAPQNIPRFKPSAGSLQIHTGGIEPIWIHHHHRSALLATRPIWPVEARSVIGLVWAPAVKDSGKDRILRASMPRFQTMIMMLICRWTWRHLSCWLVFLVMLIKH